MTEMSVKTSDLTIADCDHWIAHYEREIDALKYSSFRTNAAVEESRFRQKIDFYREKKQDLERMST